MSGVVMHTEGCTPDMTSDKCLMDVVVHVPDQKDAVWTRKRQGLGLI